MSVGSHKRRVSDGDSFLVHSSSSNSVFSSLNNSKMSVLLKMLCLFTRLGCPVDGGDPTRFDQERSVHAIAPVTTNHLNYLVGLNNDTEYYHDLYHILKPRIPGTTGHKEVGRFIINKMKGLGWHVEEDKFIANTPKVTVHMKNIIATLDPSAPRRISLACHYDSKIMREVFYGAIDSAVPCAMMMNIAQTMHSMLQKHRNERHRFTLQLIFFDGEEAFESWTTTDSIYGSRHLAQKWANEKYVADPRNNPNDETTQLHRMDLMVLLDLLGTKQPRIPSYFSDTKHFHKALIEAETLLSRSGHLKSHKKNYFTSSHSWGGIEDDHIPFLRKGVPILHVIPSPFPSVWHTYQDNEDALDGATMHNLNKILRVFVSQYLGLEKV